MATLCTRVSKEPTALVRDLKALLISLPVRHGRMAASCGHRTTGYGTVMEVMTSRFGEIMMRRQQHSRSWESRLNGCRPQSRRSGAGEARPNKRMEPTRQLSRASMSLRRAAHSWR